MPPAAEATETPVISRLAFVAALLDYITSDRNAVVQGCTGLVARILR